MRITQNISSRKLGKKLHTPFKENYFFLFDDILIQVFLLFLFFLFYFYFYSYSYSYAFSYSLFRFFLQMITMKLTTNM